MTTGKVLMILGSVLALWLGVQYLLPFFLPFLLGGLVALAAEPLVGRLSRKLPRGASAGLGVTVTLTFLLGLMSLLGALAVKELGRLANAMPDLENTARQGLLVLEDWLVGLAEQTPEGIRPLLTRTVLRSFDGSTVLVEQAASRIPQTVTAILGRVPDSALGIGTGILSAFLISARLPRLRRGIWSWLPEKARDRVLPLLQRVKAAALGWLRAQGKLMLLTWAVVSLGFLLLGIPYGILWAALIAAVDAVPMLGTGLVLLPWSLICLLQGQQLRALGLSLLFAAATLLRTTLEPRLVGKQLGLDSLVTLLALYAGYRLWGFWGLLAAPLLAAVVKSLVPHPSEE